MALRVFDFECPSCHERHEAFVQADVKRSKCKCGGIASRLIAAPRAQLEGFSGAFPSAADQWEKRRESHMAKERRNLERHGTYK